MNPAWVFAAAILGGEYFDRLTEWSDNPSREAALTMQESAWRPFAESPWARGLRQTTKDTEDWLEWHICKDLGPADPWDPDWSLECGIRYVEHLQTERFGDYCGNRHVAEQRYNGGYWVVWELDTAGSTSLADARRVCGTTLHNGRRRHERSCVENYEYPERIDRHQAKYATVLPGVLCQ